jgi:arylformamidase
MRIIDLSHPIVDGMETYPGIPGPRISEFLSREGSREHYDPGTEFQIGRIDLVANTGTYVDVPWHRYSDGEDVASFPLEKLVGLEGVVVDPVMRDERVITAERLPQDLGGKAVLFRTGWSQHWGSEGYLTGEYPYLAADTAEVVADRGAVLVGIDSLNVDNNTRRVRPVHSLLLGRGIAIIEHMTNLEKLPDSRFELHAAPPAIGGLGSFPVRVYAIVR